MRSDRSPHLFLLTKCNHWIVANNSIFHSTYQFIKRQLDLLQGSGSSPKFQYPSHFQDGPLDTEILKIESHRMCTIAYCLQTNSKTGSKRFMTYGTRYNEISAADYGIGLCLETIDTKHALEHCPKDISQKLL